MKLEIQLAASLPTAAEAATPITCRKELRVRTDALITEQIELVTAVERACEIMLSVGAILVTRNLEPHENDLIEATVACIEDARAVMDKGLTLDSESTTSCGAVMLELCVRGLLATLGVPYEHVMVEIHRARCAGEEPNVRALLEARGIIQPKAANDGQAETASH